MPPPFPVIRLMSRVRHVGVAMLVAYVKQDLLNWGLLIQPVINNAILS
jgi:hypothetical protein